MHSPENMPTIARLTLATIVLALSACAGAPFKWSDARRIQAGMTPAEVTQIVGTPTTIKANGDTLTYVWAYVSSLSGSRTLRVDFKDGHATKPPPIPPEFQD